MNKYQHIIVGTDFSAPAKAALQTAIQLAQPLQAKLYLVHCLEEMPTLIGDKRSPKLEEAEKKLMELADSIESVDVELKIGFGASKKALIEAIEELKADLLIIASHGHRGFAKFLGSTATSMTQTAPCDVLVIRPKK